MVGVCGVGGQDGPWEKEIKEAGLKPVKLCIRAGDMVLWDSRTIHCNAPATTVRPLVISKPATGAHTGVFWRSTHQARPIPEDGSVLPPRRLVAYVCMTPMARLTQDIKRQRREAYFAGYTTSHWPELVQISGASPSSLP